MKLSKVMLVTVCIFLCSLCYSLLSSHTVALLTMINYMFMLSLACTIVGGSLFVVQGGFFNGIGYSFKRFFARVSKNGAYAYELDGNLEFIQAPTYSFTYPLLLAGTLGCLITTILSVVLY